MSITMALQQISILPRPCRVAPAYDFSRRPFLPRPTVPHRHRHQQIVAVFKSKTDKQRQRTDDDGRSSQQGRGVEPLTKGNNDRFFGTSGGIGFTKENERFVGRVAMLGFAASLLGEALTGKGILAQLNLETGIPIYRAQPLLLFFILFTLLGGIGALGGRGRFAEGTTGLERAVTPKGKGVRGALGLRERGKLFGFFRPNELFVGRLAQLGIAASLIGETITGKGALAQLNIETGVPINKIPPLILLNILIFLIAAINPATGKFATDVGDEQDGQNNKD